MTFAQGRLVAREMIVGALARCASARTPAQETPGGRAFAQGRGAVRETSIQGGVGVSIRREDCSAAVHLITRIAFRAHGLPFHWRTNFIFCGARKPSALVCCEPIPGPPA